MQPVPDNTPFQVGYKREYGNYKYTERESSKKLMKDAMGKKSTTTEDSDHT